MAEQRQWRLVKAGQRYQARQNIEVACMTSWDAPFTGGYTRTLPAGEVFTVSHDPVMDATAVYCDPDNYKRLHKAFVPLSDRIMFWVYRGFCLCIRLDIISQFCELLIEDD